VAVAGHGRGLGRRRGAAGPGGARARGAPYQLGEPDPARRLFERSLAIWRELGNREEQARELNSLGITHRHLGEVEAARALLQEAIAIGREVGPRCGWRPR